MVEGVGGDKSGGLSHPRVRKKGVLFLDIPPHSLPTTASTPGMRFQLVTPPLFAISAYTVYLWQAGHTTPPDGKRPKATGTCLLEQTKELPEGKGESVKMTQLCFKNINTFHKTFKNE